MKVLIDKILFWFLKEGSELDLSRRDHLDMYVQQIITRGRTPDIKKLLSTVSHSDFTRSFARVKNFLPQEVKNFWEEGLGYLE
ncbi:MAG: hypothetical protein V2A65_03155 [Candidatus Omnitrophota bacterium]